MDQKRMFIIAGVLILILIIAGGAFFVLSQKQAPAQQTTDQTRQTQSLPTLSPADIGMSLAVTRGGKSVTMTVTKVSDITSMDYEVTYTADNNNNDVPRGVIGHIDVNAGDIQKTQEVVLGTCSDVCHYDTVVSPVKFSVKVTKNDGKVYEVDQSISL